MNRTRESMIQLLLILHESVKWIAPYIQWNVYYHTYIARLHTCSKKMNKMKSTKTIDNHNKPTKTPINPTNHKISVHISTSDITRWINIFQTVFNEIFKILANTVCDWCHLHNASFTLTLCNTITYHIICLILLTIYRSYRFFLFRQITKWTILQYYTDTLTHFTLGNVFRFLFFILCVHEYSILMYKFIQSVYTTNTYCKHFIQTGKKIELLASISLQKMIAHALGKL